MICHINIGSNTGDRMANTGRAVALVSALSERPARVSSAVESDPWGFESPNRFVNVGVEIDTALTPRELLARLQEIERSLGATPHRDSGGNYIDRNIDIDIICCGDTVVSSPALTLPHPRLAGRLFVLAPLAELSPLWRHPETGLTAREMLAALVKSAKTKEKQ